MNADILITGGSGRAGKLLSKLLSQNGISHILSSRNPMDGVTNWISMDLADGKGIDAAVKDKRIVVHLASGTKKFDRNIDVDGTERLLNAALASGVQNFIYLSIVGVDKMPVAYYRYKLEAEEKIRSSGNSFTIFRATQFHEFIDAMFRQYLSWPLAMLPKRAKIQPVDTQIVVDELYRLIHQPASNGIHDLGGPEVLDLDHLYSTWKAARRRSSFVIPLPAIGNTIRALNAGALTCPEKSAGGLRWQQWLENRYAR